MTTSDQSPSWKQLQTDRVRFVVGKLTDDELNAVFMTRQTRHDLAASLGCSPYFLFSLAAAEDAARCLSRPSHVVEVARNTAAANTPDAERLAWIKQFWEDHNYLNDEDREWLFWMVEQAIAAGRPSQKGSK